MYWAGYDSIRRALAARPGGGGVQQLQQGEQGECTVFTHAFAAGAGAGAVATIITHPFDVVKTRQQLEGVGTSQSSSLQSAAQQQQRSALHYQPAAQQQQRAWPLLLKLCREEGPRGMFRGLSARVAKVAPACAIMISSYEGGKSLFANMQ
eukprot:3236-Heterococcus_DN1.PRE.1